MNHIAMPRFHSILHHSPWELPSGLCSCPHVRAYTASTKHNHTVDALYSIPLETPKHVCFFTMTPTNPTIQ